MTAPFNPRTASVRDPFAAFLCDDQTADAMRIVATDFGWAPEKVQAGGLKAAVTALSVAASPTILLVDLSDCADPLTDINALAEVCEPGTVVITCGTVNDVRLYRELTGSGLQDYLLKPISPDQLRDAMTHAHMTLAAPRGGEAVVERPHVMTAVVGVRGGVGATSIAASCALALSQKEGNATALLDLDVHFGTGALALDLEPGRGLTDAIENPQRIDGLFIERAMVRASDTLAVLSAEAPMTTPLETDGAAFFQLQDELRNGFACTVIDMPRAMLVQHPHLFYEVNHAVVVTELTLAAARDCIRVLSWIKASAPSTQVIVVANKVPAQPEMSRKDFENSIERPVDIVVPLDAKVAMNAARTGKPMVDSGKSSKAGQALAALADRLCAAADGEPLARPRKASLLGQLRAFKTARPKPATPPKKA